MVRDHQLLTIFRDYFHFVTKFFEVINLSAPHIYHSALELSPQSSIVQKNYHDHPFQGSQPRVVYGVSNSWDQPTIIGGDYGPCTWSPCGQFFSVMVPYSIEIRDPITLEKHSSLHLTEPNPNAWNPILEHNPPDLLAYSPDGYSLAGYFGSVITIWDIQTGGVAEVIECGTANFLPSSLVWSSDGVTIGAVCWVEEETWVVCTYDVASGVNTCTSTLPSTSKPYLWPHNNSLQVMTMLSDRGVEAIVNIFEVHPTLLDNLIESFSINLNLQGAHFKSISFSPATYRISTTATTEHPNPTILLVFDIQNSKVLLQEEGPFDANCFSPDGDVLVASWLHRDTYIWKHSSDWGYTLWRKLPCWGGESNIPRSYRFSPAGSSILISRGTSLELHWLDDPVASPATETGLHYGEFSNNGTYVVTATRGGWVITITNLHINSSWFIDAEFEICALALTGNILLVQGVDAVVAWKLTVEGMVDGVLGARRADCCDSLWTKQLQEGDIARFWVEGQIGVVEHSGDLTQYSIGTGEELVSVPVEVPPPFSSPWKDFEYNSTHYGFAHRSSFSCEDFLRCDGPSEDDLPDSVPWYKEGWVKYPEGEYRHRFWLPAHWRPGWDMVHSTSHLGESHWEEAHWLGDVSTLRLITPSEDLVIIKF